jgi:hypothetical protein
VVEHVRTTAGLSGRHLTAGGALFSTTAPSLRYALTAYGWRGGSSAQ